MPHSFMYLKRRPFGRLAGTAFRVTFAAASPPNFIGSIPISSNDALLLPWADSTSRGAPLPSSFCVHPPLPGRAAQAGHTQLPLVSAPPGWAAQARLQQVLDKADAVVIEHHAVAFLGRIKIDICADGKIMIAVRIAEGLLHVPYMLRILVGFIDSQERH